MIVDVELPVGVEIFSSIDFAIISTLCSVLPGSIRT